MRDFDLDPGERGDEAAFVFHAAAAGTMSPVVMNVRMRGNPAPLAARLPVIAAEADTRLYVQDSRSLKEWHEDRNDFTNR